MIMSRKLNVVILFLLGILLLGYACGERVDSHEFTVSGKLNNVTDSYFIAAQELADTLIVDTIRINDKGEFSFKGKIDTMAVMSLYFNQNTKYAYILVDKGWNVTVKGDVLYADLVDVKGGDINDDITAFKQANKELLKTRADILYKEKEKKGSSASLMSASPEDVGGLKNIEFELANIATQYVKDNPTKISSVIVINTFFKNESFIPRLDQSLLLLRGEAEYFPLTSMLKQYSRKVKRSTVGATAPYFKLKDEEGKNVTLYDYKGKYLLLSFSSTTCEYCEAEVPEMIEVYDSIRSKYKEKDVEFLTVLIDGEQRAMRKTQRDSIKWTILPEEGSWSSPIFDDYNIHLIPAHILISPENKIIERYVSLYSLPAKLETLKAKDKEEDKNLIK